MPMGMMPRLTIGMALHEIRWPNCPAMVVGSHTALRRTYSSTSMAKRCRPELNSRCCRSMRASTAPSTSSIGTRDRWMDRMTAAVYSRVCIIPGTTRLEYTRKTCVRW